MESPSAEEKSSERFSSLSFITFHEEDWKSLSPSLTIVENNTYLTESVGKLRPEAFHSLWHEAGFVFSMAMSQILTVTSLKQRGEVILD
jgi:hypothetical protein